MKKKTMALMLAFLLSVALAACSASGEEATGTEEAKEQEEQGADEVSDVTEAEDASPEDAENSEKLNEFGVTEASMDILMEKFRENMQENPDAYLISDLNESYEIVCTRFRTFEEQIQSEGFGPMNGMAMGLNAGEDLEEMLPSLLEMVEDDQYHQQVIQNSLITAIAEWKDEEGIEGEEFNAFCEAILQNYETLESDYMAPVYNEVVEGEAFQEILEQAQALNG